MQKASECKQKECKFWVNYSPEFNCALISIEVNGNMTLKEVGTRLNISAVRVKQIQDKTLKKIKFQQQFDVFKS
jgi:maltose-binding protein MalE